MMIPTDNISLNDWSASLIIDFPKDNVPILSNENDWKKWGNLLIEDGTFAVNGAPDTTGYQDWRSWARDFFYVMCNY